ncbi:hypothetical protein [Candidatus Protochlamydia sp. R18]|uniref:hypothetical protein n=1 Tax=Candidatus Protochlamydia sp. R18 TaxID=1353977 RepID=UPI000AB36A51|nr:hypothetical protein [Candidatus Protochlamydia sp. R18]
MIHILKKLFICKLIVFTFFAHPLLHAHSVTEILKSIPEDDREVLSRLFYQLMNNDHFAYTLFGDKPVSVTANFILTPYGNIFCRMKCGGYFWEKWKVWKKYEHLFPMKNYLLLEESAQTNTKNIFFINKKWFVKTICQHLKIFETILGENITPKNLLNKIERSQNFFSVIKENPILLGILLGYGQHNAELYSRRNDLRQFIDFKQIPKIPYKMLKPSKQFVSLEEEYQYLNSRLKPFSDYHYLPLIISPVHFVADYRHSQTVELQKKYQKLRGKISAIYSQGDFLEITLFEMTR